MTPAEVIYLPDITGETCSLAEFIVEPFGPRNSSESLGDLKDFRVLMWRTSRDNRMAYPQRVKVVMVVWGTKFTRFFLDYALPSHLRRGKSSNSREGNKHFYHLYTRTTDLPTIESSESYHRLKALMPIQIIPIENFLTEEFLSTKSHQAMNACHTHFATTQLEPEVAYAFMAPDAIWADGNLRHIVEKLPDYDLFFGAAFRIDSTAFAQSMDARFPLVSGVRNVPPRELVGVAVPQLHPEPRGQLWGRDEANPHSACLLFDVPGNKIWAGYFMPPLLSLSQFAVRAQPAPMTSTTLLEQIRAEGYIIFKTRMTFAFLRFLLPRMGASILSRARRLSQICTFRPRRYESYPSHTLYVPKSLALEGN